MWSGMLALLQAVCAGRGSTADADVSAGSRRQWERAAAGIICGGKAAAVDALAKGRENHVLRLLDVSGNEIREAGAKAAAVMVVQGAQTCCCCCCRRRYCSCQCSCHHLHHPAHFPFLPPRPPRTPPAPPRRQQQRARRSGWRSRRCSGGPQPQPLRALDESSRCSIVTLNP